MRDHEPVHCESCGKPAGDGSASVSVHGFGRLKLCAACSASECPLCIEHIGDGSLLAVTLDGYVHHDCLTHAMEWACECADSDHRDYETSRAEVLGYGKAAW